MNISWITETLDTLNIRPDEIADERLAEAFRILFLLIEELCEEIEKSKEEKQKLRDELNLLKGEQTNPDIKSSRKNPSGDISSEKERKPQKTIKKKKSKANDTFLAIVQTAKKLGVSTYEYFYDRISKRFRLPSLAELIRAKKFPEMDNAAG